MEVVWEWSNWDGIFVGKAFLEELAEFSPAGCGIAYKRKSLCFPHFLLFPLFFFFSPSKCSAGSQETHEHRELPMEVVT